MAKRKIGFYFILFKNGDLENPAWIPLLRVFECLCSTERASRKMDLDGNKFAFLDSFSQPEENLITALFKSAKHSYRAPLLNRNTVEERENPKTMDEGEQMKTHVVLKLVEGTPIALIESGNNLMTGNNVIDYLNRGISLYNESIENDEDKIMGRFALEMIPRDDFREVLDRMSRVTCASLFMDKRILGSDAFNFAEPSESMQEDIVVQIKAKRKKSILESLYHFVDNHNHSNTNIRRIRVVGRTESNNETVIDTGFIIKKEFVEVNQNEDTGEYNTIEMFFRIKELANQFG